MDERSTTLSARLDSGDVNYTLTLEHLPASTANGKSLGTLSAFSYVVSTSDEARPVLFLTNGGPGAASNFLHLSGIGPFRAHVPTDIGSAPSPPYGFEDSASSILDVADLVFIDAPATGFGVIAEDADLSSAYSIEGDAEVFASAIRGWVTKHGRWNCPKFFLGESYGTQRGAFLAHSSQGLTGVPLDGIALLGQAVNIQEIAERPGNVAGALANLPYKAAVAWFHGQGSTEHATVEDAVDAALTYAWSELSSVMMQGTRVPGAELRAAAEKVSSMIGIPAEELVSSRLWINKSDFRERLLRGKGLTVGVTDSRYTSLTTDSAVGESPIDATSTHLYPRYDAAFTQLLRELFGGAPDAPYAPFDMSAVRTWEWSDQGGAKFMTMGKPSPFHTYPYPARLTRWMKQLPHSRLFIGTGMYDSLTTVGAADHLVRQWDLPADRVCTHWYRGGHMMYSDSGVAAQLNADLRAFIRGGN